MSTVNLGNLIQKLFLGALVLMAGTSQAMSWDSCWENIKYCCNRLGTGAVKTLTDPIEWFVLGLMAATIFRMESRGIRISLAIKSIPTIGAGASIIRHAIPERYYPSNIYIQTILEHPYSFIYLIVKMFSVTNSNDMLLHMPLLRAGALIHSLHGYRRRKSEQSKKEKQDNKEEQMENLCLQ